MPRSDKPATLAGPCPNEACPVTATKTSGVMTEKTRGLPRINISKQGCSRCLQTGKKQRFTPFKWTPATLAEAVNYAMARLDDVA